MPQERWPTLPGVLRPSVACLLLLIKNRASKQASRQVLRCRPVFAVDDRLGLLGRMRRVFSWNRNQYCELILSACMFISASGWITRNTLGSSLAGYADSLNISAYWLSITSAFNVDTNMLQSAELKSLKVFISLLEHQTRIMPGKDGKLKSRIGIGEFRYIVARVHSHC